MSPTVSLVVPIYNMAEHVRPLWQALGRSQVLSQVVEAIFVDDGSSDPTAQVLAELAREERQDGPQVTVLRLDRNCGRFRARWAGAERARGQLLLFVDARVRLHEDFGARLADSMRQESFVQPQPLIDVSRNRFCLYWDRSHRWLFARHYRAMEQGALTLTPVNYDDFLKGTTVLLAPRELFLNCCQELGATDVWNDDTLVLRRMVQTQPLRLDPQLKFWWAPRESLGGFLRRLIDRGPSLVEYHVFLRRGWIFAAIVTGLLVLSLTLSLIVLWPRAALPVLLLELALAALSAWPMARSPAEWLRLAPLHVAVLAAVAAGVLWGLLSNGRRWLKGELRALAPRN